MCVCVVRGGRSVNFVPCLCVCVCVCEVVCYNTDASLLCRIRGKKHVSQGEIEVTVSCAVCDVISLFLCLSGV